MCCQVSNCFLLLQVLSKEVTVEHVRRIDRSYYFRDSKGVADAVILIGSAFEGSDMDFTGNFFELSLRCRTLDVLNAVSSAASVPTLDGCKPFVEMLVGRIHEVADHLKNVAKPSRV